MRCAVFAIAVLIGSGAAVGQSPASAGATPGPVQSGPPPSGVAGEVQGSYARVKGFIVKSAEAMPPEDYQFKPTPEVRTFARVVEHVIEAQTRVCGTANQTPAGDMAKTPAETADKAAIVDALKASFASCDKAYAVLTDANATQLLAMGPMKRSRLGLMWGNVSHDNEQYATLALYMRLKGIVPPSSEK